MSRHSLSPMVDLEDDCQYTEEPDHKKRNSITHLRYLRKKSGYTLDGLSRATAISVSYLSRLESGSRRLNTDLIKRLSKALNCEPAELLQEDAHDGRLVSSVDFSKRKRAEMFAKANSLPLYFIGENEDDPSKLNIIITPVTEWKTRPSELANRERCFALRADEYFMPYFGKNSTLYLESAVNFAPESTVVLLSCGNIDIKKVWSVTPTSLQLCDITDIEMLKNGDVDANNKLMNVTRSSIDFIYKVIGHSEFDLN